jgi:hypothetical protein
MTADDADNPIGDPGSEQTDAAPESATAPEDASSADEGTVLPNLAARLFADVDGIADELFASGADGGDSPAALAFSADLQQIARAVRESKDPDHVTRLASQLLAVVAGIEERAGGEIDPLLEHVIDGICGQAAAIAAEAVLAAFFVNKRSLQSAAAVVDELPVDFVFGWRLLTSVRTAIKERELEVTGLVRLLKESVDQQAFAPVFSALRAKVAEDYPQIDLEHKFFDGLEQMFRSEANRLIEQQQSKVSRQVKHAFFDLKKLRRILEGTDVGIAVLDHQGRIVSATNLEFIADQAIGDPLTTELRSAVRRFAPGTVCVYDEVEIVEVHENAEGWLDAFLFVPAG